MGKDPAFLFYPGDWLGGTMGMTLEVKGAYLELLIFQFNNGPFTEAQAKQVLSICSASVWDNLRKKFAKEGDKYYSKRLTEEVDRRKKFSESRRNNAKGHKLPSKTPKAYAQHMEAENENEDWIKWSQQIVNEEDHIWEQMKGRKVGREEMNIFLSVATRNKWKMESQQAFRTSLNGFSPHGSNGKTTPPKPKAFEIIDGKIV
jgi:uncharacterized protein YdaU (DUF1376 family)